MPPSSRSLRVAASRVAKESLSRSAIRAASFGSGASAGGRNRVSKSLIVAGSRAARSTAARQVAGDSWPRVAHTSAASAAGGAGTAQIVTDPSRCPVASRRPSGENATVCGPAPRALGSQAMSGAANSASGLPVSRSSTRTPRPSTIATDRPSGPNTTRPTRSPPDNRRSTRLDASSHTANASADLSPFSSRPAINRPSAENHVGAVFHISPTISRSPLSVAGMNSSVPVRVWYTFPPNASHRPHGENGGST